MFVGMLTLYGMTMGGMTSMLTNIDSKRSSYIHTYKAFKDEVVTIQLLYFIAVICS